AVLWRHDQPRGAGTASPHRDLAGELADRGARERAHPGDRPAVSELRRGLVAPVARRVPPPPFGRGRDRPGARWRRDPVETRRTRAPRAFGSRTRWPRGRSRGPPAAARGPARTARR